MRFKDLETKDEHITYCLNNDKDIKKIDSTIPIEIYRCCKNCGILTSNLVTVHYTNGTVTYEDILALALVVHKKAGSA